MSKAKPCKHGAKFSCMLCLSEAIAAFAAIKRAGETMSKCDIKPLSPTMNPELKQRWLQALRSGTYAQGQKALCQNGKFCCLGVLCDIGLPEEWRPGQWGVSNLSHPWGNPTDEILYHSISDEIKLDRALQQRLANMNDQGKSFIEIAEVIEAEA